MTTLTQSLALSTLYSTLALLILALSRLPLALIHTLLPAQPTSLLAPTLVASILEPPLLLLGTWQAAQFVVWELDGGEGLVAVGVGLLALGWLTLVIAGAVGFVFATATTAVVAAAATESTVVVVETAVPPAAASVMGVASASVTATSSSWAVYAALAVAFALMPYLVFASKRADEVEERLVCVIEKGAAEQEEYCTR